MSDILNCPNFTYAEFACKCGKCRFKGRDIDPRIPVLCQEIREALGRPLRINSACRCDKHNAAEGGKSQSQHLEANDFRAVDLGISKSWERGIALKIALKHGVKGVGINKAFMHFDFRPTPLVVFFY